MAVPPQAGAARAEPDVVRKRRDFGRVRQLPSGRWQARYPGPDGVDRPAPKTFATRREADRWLASMGTELARGQWVDPSAGDVSLGDWAQQWLATKPRLKQTTRQL